MDNMRVLVVDDDPKIRKLMRSNLEKRGFRVQETHDGSGAIKQMQFELPDLVLLDLVMPGGVSGPEVCSWIRQRSDIPIIVVSAYHEEDIKVQALDAGADDFVTKPFGYSELMARIRAVMRRAVTINPLPSAREKIRICEMSIDLHARRVFVNDEDIHLTRTEFALLAELAQHMNGVLTHDELLARVWGEEYRGSSHYLHVYFGRIRKKMGDQASAALESVPGVGYILHSA
jgi:two-component system KDP operon response regulator KdpE